MPHSVAKIIKKRKENGISKMKYQDTFLVNADQSFKAEDWSTVGHKSRDGLPAFCQVLEQSSKKFHTFSEILTMLGGVVKETKPFWKT